MSHYKLDVTKEHCPMTYVRTKIQLSKLAIGETLEVLVTEGEPLENIPRSASEQGYTVEAVHETLEKGIYSILIRK